MNATGIQSKAAILTLTVGLLASCSNLEGVPTPPEDGYAFAVTVNLKAGDSRESLEQRYQGHVYVWNAQDGFAILGSDTAPANDPAVRGLDKNTNAYTTPETELAAAPPPLGPEAVGAGSWNAWSGGWSAWSGNWSAWSGGTGTSLSPSQNQPLWGKIGLNSTTLSRAPLLGNGVKIAVIDTGVDLSHPALVSRLVPAAERWDFVDNDAVPQEVGVAGTDAAFGHGTGVAGVIAQVAPNAKIMPLRVLRPNGQGDETAVASAVDWARTRGARIIHMSLGGTTDSTALRAAVTSAVNAGIVVVASVGNNNVSSGQYPARYADIGDSCFLTCWNRVLGVASVSNGDKKSSFSNYDLGVSLSAPGEYVYTPFPGNRLGYWSGTSFAAPMVTGTLALALGQNPNANLTSLVSNLRAGSDDINTLNMSYVTELGDGRLNIAKFFGRIGL